MEATAVICPVVGCTNPAEWHVWIQWSIADFTDDYTCPDHVDDTYAFWLRFDVDDNAPCEITMTRLDNL